MPRKPLPPVVVDRSRAQKAPVATSLAVAIDGTRLAGARQVPIDQVVPDPNQPRRDWDAEDASGGLDELAASLREFGVLQPLLVREEGFLTDGCVRYIIIAGGRRRAAAARAGLTTLPVVVRDDAAGRVRLLQLIENIQRRALAPLDEARAYQEIIDAEGITAADLSRRLHISEQTVRDRLLVLSDQPIADAVQRGQIGTAVARDILRAAPEPQADLRARVDAGEAVTRTTVQDARARSATAGVTNPRKTGGGRRKVDQSPHGDRTHDHNSNSYVRPVVDDGGRAQGREHNSYGPPSAPVVAVPSAQAAVRALAAAVEAGELRAYTDAMKARDPRYRSADDPYVAGFVAALAAMRQAVEG